MLKKSLGGLAKLCWFLSKLNLGQETSSFNDSTLFIWYFPLRDQIVDR